jgi:hypothetical protein
VLADDRVTVVCADDGFEVGDFVAGDDDEQVVLAVVLSQFVGGELEPFGAVGVCALAQEASVSGGEFARERLIEPLGVSGLVTTSRASGWILVRLF